MVKKVLFISSTGGHLVELLALKELFNEYEYYLVTEKDHTNEFLKDRYSNRVSYLWYGTSKKLFSYLFKFSFNILKSFFLFLKFNPDVVITTGTHTAVPMMFIAKLFKRKTIYIETFANRYKPTKTGKILYGKTDYFIVQWPELMEVYPSAIYGGWIL